MSEQVQIAAGGYGTRLRPYMEELGYDASYPKQLLPTGTADGETFLGRIVRQALPLTTPEQLTLHVNQDNQFPIRRHPEIPSTAQFDNRPHNHSLDMFFDRLITSGQRVIGCAGDYYAEEDLQALLDHHESSGFPVTALAGYSPSVDSGVALRLDKTNRILQMRRGNRFMKYSLFNIGAYVFEPDRFVLRLIQTHRPSATLAPADDRIFEAFMRHGLLGAYTTELPAFDVSSADTYKAVLAHTQSSAAQAAIRQTAVEQAASA